MKCDLPGLYVQPRGGVKGLKDGECAHLFSLEQSPTEFFFFLLIKVNQSTPNISCLLNERFYTLITREEKTLRPVARFRKTAEQMSSLA